MSEAMNQKCAGRDPSLLQQWTDIVARLVTCRRVLDQLISPTEGKSRNVPQPTTALGLLQDWTEVVSDHVDALTAQLYRLQDRLQGPVNEPAPPR